jgi:predicted phage tail protein
MGARRRPLGALGTDIMMRTVRLYGHLAEEFGDEFKLAVETAGEAIRALKCNFNTFYTALEKGEYELIRGSRERGIWLELDQVNELKLGDADFHIVPVIAGSKNSGGVIKTVIGVALIGIAVFASGGALATAIPGLSGMLTYGNLAMLGVGLALAGISSLLAPKDPAGTTMQQSYQFGVPNVVDQGVPVPLVYGRCITSPVLISAGLDVEPIPLGWDPTAGDTIYGVGNMEKGNYITTDGGYTGATRTING